MRILVPSSGKEAATEIAEYVARLAKQLDATLVAIHILSDGENKAEGQACCDVLEAAAREAGVTVETRVAAGDVVATIIQAADESNADLILMGASKGAVVKRWLSADVMQQCEIPVLVVPHCYGQ